MKTLVRRDFLFSLLIICLTFDLANQVIAESLHSAKQVGATSVSSRAYATTTSSFDDKSIPDCEGLYSVDNRERSEPLSLDIHASGSGRETWKDYTKNTKWVELKAQMKNSPYSSYESAKAACKEQGMLLPDPTQLSRLSKLPGKEGPVLKNKFFWSSSEYRGNYARLEKVDVLDGSTGEMFPSNPFSDRQFGILCVDRSPTADKWEQRVRPNFNHRVFIAYPRDDEENKALLGVTLVDTTDGIKVLAVQPASIADKAGIKAGEIIYSAQGNLLKNSDELVDLVKRAPVCLRLRTSSGRNVWARFPDWKNKSRLGVTYVPSENGVRIVEVENDSPASSFGLKPGYEILTVDGIKPRSVEHFAELIANSGSDVSLAFKDRNGREWGFRKPLRFYDRGRSSYYRDDE